MSLVLDLNCHYALAFISSIFFCLDATDQQEAASSPARGRRRRRRRLGRRRVGLGGPQSHVASVSGKRAWVRWRVIADRPRQNGTAASSRIRRLILLLPAVLCSSHAQSHILSAVASVEEKIACLVASESRKAALL